MESAKGGPPWYSLNDNTCIWCSELTLWSVFYWEKQTKENFIFVPYILSTRIT